MKAKIKGETDQPGSSIETGGGCRGPQKFQIDYASCPPQKTREGFGIADEYQYDINHFLNSAPSSPLVGNDSVSPLPDQASLNEGLTDADHGRSIGELPSITPPSFLYSPTGGNASRSLGQAGEYLVMADLIFSGYQPIEAPAGASYDIAVLVDDFIVKMQVKTTALESNMRGSSCNGYQFKVARKAKVNGKRKHVRYTAKEMNLIALVGLDDREIAYFPYFGESTPWTYNLQSRKSEIRPRKNSNYFDQHPFSVALSQLIEKKSA